MMDSVLPDGAEQSWALDLTVLGLNSGTSMMRSTVLYADSKQQDPDEPVVLELLKYGETPLDPKIKTRVMNMILHNRTSPEEIAQGNVILGEAFAAAAEDFLTSNNIGRSRVDVMAPMARRYGTFPAPWASK
ncbi:hypothetical protein J3459_008572 [Metarhizium acridum]|uniref:uncharacterized protein n=1 Tax=Metarhizium acridum TaxID=92637 RepID=UPI001C6B59C4|nr:hypothetical protein J3458_006833 [Metarhizium acridum]KAG8425973.1 hypothetical protein J3459_008572 [Metarhizium acridum]